MKSRISREEALAFILTHLVVERQVTFELNQVTLFQLTNLATEAADKLNRSEGLIPHEVIETIASEFQPGAPT